MRTNKRIQNDSIIKSKSISFAIAVPCFNEEQNIGALLDLLCTGWNSEYTPDKIAVFSSECKDRTEDIVKDFSAKSSIPVILITEEKRSGKCHAINQLIDIIGSVDVIILVSSDVQISGTNLIKILKKFNQEDTGVVAGRPVPVCDEINITYRVTKVLWNIHHLMVLQVPKSTEVTAFRNLGFHLDENSLVDEAEIEWNLSKKGCSIRYCPSATIKTLAPQTLNDHIRQRIRVMLGHYVLRKKRHYTVGSMKPNVRIKALLKYIRSDDTDYLAFAIFLMVEVWVTLVSNFLSILRGNTGGRWKRIASAKRKFN